MKGIKVTKKEWLLSKRWEQYSQMFLLCKVQNSTESIMIKQMTRDGTGLQEVLVLLPTVPDPFKTLEGSTKKDSLIQERLMVKKKKKKKLIESEK